jgi:hypothetical protein
MSVQDILRFLKTPAEFAADLPEEAQDAWLSALADVVEPMLEQSGDHPLREAQVSAWRNITHQRASLVLGPPGTGKTFVLAWMALGYLLARRRQGLPCRVLVTGFTRNSILNILESIAAKADRHLDHDQRPKVAYLAGQSPDLGNHHIVWIKPDAAADLIRDDEHLIAGCTAWGLYKLIEQGDFPGKDRHVAPIFDLICIDEASQMLVSQGLLCLAGLAMGGRVLVAGDNKQLPPVRRVNNFEFDKRKLGGSLYDFLESADIPPHPLTETFRLNAPLARYPREQIYEGGYHPFGEAIERRLPLRENWREGLASWEQHVLDPEHPVAVVLHDGPACGSHNPFEVNLACHLSKLLHDRLIGDSCGERFWIDGLAVISPHRAQNAAIRETLRLKGFKDDAVVETVDRIQGRERDAIIASYTVSDDEFALAEADFIFSAERFNVMITRARTKLILIISRRLFEAIPSDEAVFKSAQLIREFVYSSTLVDDFTTIGPDGRSINASLRLRRFDDEAPMPVVDETEIHPLAEVDEPLPPHLASLLKLIRAKCAENTQWGTVNDYELRPFVRENLAFADLRELFVRGWITLDQRFPRSGKGHFWSIKALEYPREPFPADPASVRSRIQEAIHRASRRRGPALYDYVRSAFQWVSPAEDDVLEPVINQLKDELNLRWGETPDGKKTIDIDLSPDELPEAPAETLTQDDFVILNHLEDMEAKRINLGIFESWITVPELAAGLDRTAVALVDPVRRLGAHRYLMQTNDGRLRSRMAEMAREIRYVKQRFDTGDTQRRPYLVRSLKLELVNRDKPLRNAPFAGIAAQLKAQCGSDPLVMKVIAGLGSMLQSLWQTDSPNLAGFQGKTLTSILPAWLGEAADDAFVITADTGSGKTEAATFPLIAGAAMDALRGIRGTRAILIYPRIQLGVNQAQRLAGYLAALARVPGMPVLSIGVQNMNVPRSYDRMSEAQSAIWKVTPTGDRHFPLFACPDKGCASQLLVQPGKGSDGLDRLHCSACDWHFDGWVGSKQGLATTPPGLLLVTTESLHQWLQDPAYAAIFGNQNWPAPRAVLADEIHLYSGVHGAQVGYTLRRLLARIGHGSGRNPLAIGMSATLGKPEAVWGGLVGRQHVHRVQPEAAEREFNPLGREYFYFVQPEVESRGKDIAGASTTIQTLMCLAHGMRRRTGTEGGFRALAFLDSIDKLKRLHGDFLDAEENKSLAALRTWLYDPTPENPQPRRTCCGDPETCDTFRQGECWYFAATDDRQVSTQRNFRSTRHLKVSDRPVFSGTSNGAEDMIQQSDVVFATSSLEVGFDDPDMILVYQHYAPANLASFVQRKGRGGRGTDDRPITGVTLSVYSPRDARYFRRPRLMLDAAGFEIPLNMKNYFIIRGQALALILDCMALWRIQSGESSVMPTKGAFDLARDMAAQVLGAAYLKALDIDSLEALWKQACRIARIQSPPTHPRDLRQAMPWTPSTLFETINLPTVQVSYEERSGRYEAWNQAEDITFAFNECAPGNVTRRYSMTGANWLPPVEGTAPMMTADDYLDSMPFHPLGQGESSTELLEALPIEAREELGPDLSVSVIRPARLRLRHAGSYYGADPNPSWVFDPRTRRIAPADVGKGNISLKSRGRLRGYLIVDAEAEQGHAYEHPSLGPISNGLNAYLGRDDGSEQTGLHVSRVFWGVDAELRIETGKRSEDAFLRQTFADPHSGKPALHGYEVWTEGVQIRIEPAVLESFLDQEMARLDTVENIPESRWLRGQYLRYLAQVEASVVGMKYFEARQVADLVVAASATDEGWKRLKGLLEAKWDSMRFLELLEQTYINRLQHHPTLTLQRVQRLKDAIEKPAFREAMRKAIRTVRDPDSFRFYLRSTILHGLAVRLAETFVLQGRGDERKVLCHVQLPIQFGKIGDDTITVFENGSHGDGTTRTFLQHLDEALAPWSQGYLAYCPNAEEDALIERICEREADIERWRSWDPNQLEQMEQLAKDLGLASSDSMLQAAIRLLYGTEEWDGQRYANLDLHREVRSVRLQLVDAMKREPTTWELVGSVVRLAESGDGSVPQWSQLLAIYRSLTDASHEESLDPGERLADQVHRLSARLCVDGCQSCLHASSSLMADELAEVSVSRNVLERFSQHVYG